MSDKPSVVSHGSYDGGGWREMFGGTLKGNTIGWVVSTDELMSQRIHARRGAEVPSPQFKARSGRRHEGDLIHYSANC